MNRRMFMKVAGMAVAGLSALPFSTPKVLSQIVIPECPGCAAGLPIKKIGWVVYYPKAIILNDNAITKIALTGA